MKRHNTLEINDYKNIRIRDLELDKESYIIFCWDKKDYYHMITIINNTAYDKDDKYNDLYIIKVYKKY